MAESSTPSHETVLDVTAERIARTYAQGFLGAVGYDAAAVEELEAVDAEVLRAHPGFAQAMASAFLDHETREGMIDRVLGGRVQPAVVNLLKVLSVHGRSNIVSQVARQARKALNHHLGRQRVLVRLAHEASPELMQEIEQTIREKTGIEPIVEVEIDPELVGGLEVRVGDTVYDGSVRTAFRVAHRAIVAETIQAIESNPRRFTLADG